MNEPVQPKLPAQYPPTGETTVRGVVESVVWQNADKSFSVVKFRGLDGKISVVVGDLGSVTIGESVRVAGKWEEHGTHGRQLRAHTMVPELPTTPLGIEKLLASGFVDGIGAGMAKRIVAAFGSATLDVIADHPERLREVSGIGAGRAERIELAFRARRAESEARSFLQAVGIGPALARRIIKKYGDQTPAVVRADPYRIAIDVGGVGFRTADRIGRQVGIADDDPRRVAGAVLHAVGEASEQGHTGLPPANVHAIVVELGIPADRVDTAIESLVERKLLIRDFDLLYPPPLFSAERNLAARLASMVNDGVSRIDPRVLQAPEVARALAVLHPTQQEAVRATLSSPVMILTGGPGTGKTTTVRAIVAVMKAARQTICLAAPTGRAARRLSEATGTEARTLHRALEWNPRIGGFARGVDAPLEADLVLVDESSMLDVVLASRLVAAVKPGARLVFVGDFDQLPSVGPGTVLADLLATPSLPSVRLTEVFRQAAASAIVRGAHEVLHARIPTPSPPRTSTTPAPPSGELYFVRADDPERAAELLVETVVRRIPRSFGLDPLRDVQVLVPTHKGPLGTIALNRMLQREMNPAAAAASEELVPRAPDEPLPPPRLHVGDKVMQFRNDYDLEVWNGDIGRVSAMERDVSTVVIDGRDVVYRGEARESLGLAYAATVHKSQGSEYDAVVIGLHTSHFVLLSRALIYTALTRARRLVVVVGSENALRIAVNNARTAARFGALGARLAAMRIKSH